MFTDGDWILSQHLKTGDDVRLLQLADVGITRFLNKSQKNISRETADELGVTFLAKDDVLISRMAHPLARACLFPQLTRPCITAVDVAIARCDRTVSIPKYLMYLCNSLHVLNRAEAVAVGTTRKRISRKNLEQIYVPLPPLPEQRRIVAKLEEVLGKVDACQKRLERIPLLLKRFRQSVLAAACSGRLTEDWRGSNLHESVASTAPEGSPEAPSSWSWSKLSDISELRGGVTKGRKLAGMKTISLPYLRVANVQDGFLDLREIKQIDVLPSDKEKYRLESGDILFTEGGDRDKLGRGTIWNGEIPGCIHQNHIFRARLTRCDIAPAYVSLATKSDHSRRYFFDNASQTVNLASINLTTLSALPIPIPPHPEQNEILRRVQSLFKLADRIESRYKAAKASVDQLTQSILAKAFRGELVPQDPKDEAASKLLKRTRANGSRPLEAARA